MYVDNSPMLRLLVPIINSPLDRVALTYAATLGRVRSISLCLLEVVTDVGLLEAADTRLSRLVNDMASEHIDVRRLLRVGDFAPTVALVAGVTGADTILFASDGASSLDARLNGDVVTDLSDETSTPLILLAPSGAASPPRVLVHDSGDMVATGDPFISEFVQATDGEVLLSDAEFGTPQAVLDAAHARGANLVALNREHLELRNPLLAGGISVLILN